MQPMIENSEPKIVPGDVIAVIGEFDGLTASAAAALALGRAFRPARGEQLELLEPAQQFRSDEACGH